VFARNLKSLNKKRVEAIDFERLKGKCIKLLDIYTVNCDRIMIYQTEMVQ